MNSPATIIILNYNGRQHLETCLQSLFKQTYREFDVIMVDNGSSDSSIAYVRKNFAQVKIIEAGKNYGFAEGNNIGIREALRNPEVKYIVTLNNDTEVKVDWLKKLVKVAESDEDIGACASKLLYFDQRNIVDSAGDFYFTGSLKVFPRGHGKSDKYFQTEECLSACAGAALYRREALEQSRLGNDFFDSDHFAYIEDTDLSLRIRLMEWKCVFVPEAVVYHKVSATFSQMKNNRKKFLTARSRIFVMIKIYPLAWWPKALKNPFTYQAGGTGLFENAFFYTKLFFSVLVKIPSMLGKRRNIRRSRKFGNEIFSQWAEKFSKTE
ncbi:MAG: glycosyltransferase family 2 protein [Patescibacteria group bacterium]|jgi:hypothetical protein